ncbi:MAG TPA: ADOP family duplicated permease [Vicinamibacterales bacterium]|nr:ADOP family duplicated permease [Vicinamibacterales bacterium]
MEQLRRDFNLACRSLRRQPGFTAVVALTLGLGIGANTAVFSVVDAVLLRDLPYPYPENLAVLWGELPEQGLMRSRLSGPELAAIWEEARSFESMGAVWTRPGVLKGNEGPAEEVEVGWITPGFLETLRVGAHVGRLPTREELVADPSDVMVLGFDLWQRRYGADPAIVGRSIDFDGERRTVVGVMPRSFRLHLPPDQGVAENLAAFLPWGGSDYRTLPRAFRVFTPVARLALGISTAQAAAEMKAVAESVRSESIEYGRSGFGLRPELLAAGVAAHVRPTLLLLLGVVTIVLLVACANVTNLSLARAADAERDFRMRSALGASRAMLFRQMLAESALLGALAAGVGLLVAMAGQNLLHLFEPGRLPRIQDLSVDPRVIAYAAAASFATSLLFGCLSAKQALAAAGASGLPDAARTTAGRPARLRRALVVSQVAMSFVLLAGAGLLVQSFSRLLAVDPGFDPAGVLTARISLPDVLYRYRDQGPRIAGFYQRLDERLRALPGVRAVGATTAPPLSGASGRPRPYAWRGSDGDIEWGRFAADYTTVTPGWFEAAGVTLIAGRFLTDRDDLGHPIAVVVDAALANRAWGGARAAAGEPLRVEIFRDGEFQSVWGEVVGVIDAVRLDRLESPGREQVYLAHAQSPQRTMYPTLRAEGDPLALVAAIQREVAALEADLPVFDVRLASEHVAGATAVSRFALFTLGAFAAVAVLLAAAGVHAVMAHSVSRRRYEIGVRLALGATPRRIRRLILRQGMTLAACGVGLGLLGALALTDLLSGLLFGVAPRDPWTLASAAALLVCVASVACAAPARHASRLPPTEALRGP